jgi:hypothetical protein
MCFLYSQQMTLRDFIGIDAPAIKPMQVMRFCSKKFPFE